MGKFYFILSKHKWVILCQANSRSHELILLVILFKNFVLVPEELLVVVLLLHLLVVNLVLLYLLLLPPSIHLSLHKNTLSKKKKNNMLCKKNNFLSVFSPVLLYLSAFKKTCLYQSCVYIILQLLLLPSSSPK